jgi:hypothetical protein
MEDGGTDETGTPMSARTRIEGRAGRPAPRLKACRTTGKVRFPDSRAAVEALHRAKTIQYFAELDSTPTRRRECRHYRCRECKGWHLTSTPAWEPSILLAA